MHQDVGFNAIVQDTITGLVSGVASAGLKGLDIEGAEVQNLEDKNVKGSREQVGLHMKVVYTCNQMDCRLRRFIKVLY